MESNNHYNHPEAIYILNPQELAQILSDILFEIAMDHISQNYIPEYINNMDQNQFINQDWNANNLLLNDDEMELLMALNTGINSPELDNFSMQVIPSDSSTPEDINLGIETLNENFNIIDLTYNEQSNIENNNHLVDLTDDEYDYIMNLTSTELNHEDYININNFTEDEPDN